MHLIQILLVSFVLWAPQSWALNSGKLEGSKKVSFSALSIFAADGSILKKDWYKLRLSFQGLKVNGKPYPYDGNAQITLVTNRMDKARRYDLEIVSNKCNERRPYLSVSDITPILSKKKLQWSNSETVRRAGCDWMVMVGAGTPLPSKALLEQVSQQERDFLVYVAINARTFIEESFYNSNGRKLTPAEKQAWTVVKTAFRDEWLGDPALMMSLRNSLNSTAKAEVVGLKAKSRSEYTLCGRRLNVSSEPSISRVQRALKNIGLYQGKISNVVNAQMCRAFTMYVSRLNGRDLPYTQTGLNMLYQLEALDKAHAFAKRSPARLCGMDWTPNPDPFNSGYDDPADIQRGLLAAGYSPGAVDGVLGPNSCTALSYYAINKTDNDGSFSREEIDRLIAQGMKGKKTPEPRLTKSPAKVTATDDRKGPELKTGAGPYDDDLLDAVQSFATAQPGVLDSVHIASLYLPAKDEYEKGELGPSFRKLRAYTLSQPSFVSYLKRKHSELIEKQRLSALTDYEFIEQQLAELKAEIAHSPFSAKALAQAQILRAYSDLSSGSSPELISAGASRLKQELASLETKFDENQKAVNGMEPEASNPLSQEELSAPSSTLQTEECDSNPRLCPIDRLCENATKFETGKLIWDDSLPAKPFVAFAQGLGLACGVSAKPVAKIVNLEATDTKKVRIDKYKNRKALVIGNANYLDQSPLKNPINDAKAVSSKLKEVGFDVTYKENLTEREFGRTLSDFEAQLSGSDISLLYYAGHGIEVDKRNYLIPVDAKLRSTRDVRYETIELDDAVSVALNTSKLSMVLIDACRNNPFTGRMSDKSRSVSRGLSVVEVNTGPVYQIVSFAAASGQIAEDGKGGNSPYASVLIDLLDEPNLEVGKMFRLLGQRVSELTNGKQQPTKRDNLRGEDIYLVQYE